MSKKIDTLTMSKNISNIIKEELNTILKENDVNNKIICIKSKLEDELKKYKNNNDDKWIDIKQILRKIDGYFDDGYFLANAQDRNRLMSSFLNDLNYSNYHPYKQGEFVDTIGNNLKVYKAIGDKTLFRGVSLNDWYRIKNQGFIDSDMRNAVFSDEGINLAQNPQTAIYYLPSNEKSVILAINPKNLDLYMLKDEYIRVFHDIPIKNIVKVSDIIIKGKDGNILSTNTENKINEIIDQLKKLNIEINC